MTFVFNLGAVSLGVPKKILATTDLIHILLPDKLSCDGLQD